MSLYGENNQADALNWLQNYRVTRLELSAGAWFIVFEDGREIEFDGLRDGTCYMELYGEPDKDD